MKRQNNVPAATPSETAGDEQARAPDGAVAEAARTARSPASDVAVDDAAAAAAAPELTEATPEERLAALQAERDDFKDRMLRIAAEFENWKKRARKDADRRGRRGARARPQGHARGGRQPRARGRHARPAATAPSTAARCSRAWIWCCALLKQKLERYEVQAVRRGGPAVRPARARGDLARRQRRRSGRQRRGGAAEGLPRRRAAAAAGAGVGVVGGREGRTAAARRRARLQPPVGRLLRNARRRSRLDRRRNQGRVSQAGAEVAPGPQSRRQGGRGAVQGAGDRLFGAVRRARSAATTIATARSTDASRSAATDITGATEFFDALFGDLFGLHAAAIERRARPALHAGAGLRGGGARAAKR